ncbi:MAG: GNAT family N-acetyltransferase [Clostridiales bacterium]|nr:GNAT family N-acetyltransferase [Clostridiales bacterium]
MKKNEIFIRKFQLSDLNELYNVLSDPEVMRYVESPYSLEQTKDFLIRAGLCEVPLVFAAEKDGKFIGYVIFHEYDADSYELGWVLDKKYWGKGYATIITKNIIAKACEMKKDLVIECVPEQEKTKHLALANGFTYIGNIDNLDVFKLKI